MEELPRWMQVISAVNTHISLLAASTLDQARAPTSRRIFTTTRSRGTLVSTTYPAPRLNIGSTVRSRVSTRATSSGRFPYELVILVANRSAITSAGAVRRTTWSNRG